MTVRTQMEVLVLLLFSLGSSCVAQKGAIAPPQLFPALTYEVETAEGIQNTAYIIGEAVASEFDRHVPVLSDNLREELNGMRNSMNRQLESLKSYMDVKLDRMQQDAPSKNTNNQDNSETTTPYSPAATIRHNLAMAELRRLGSDLMKAMNEEVSKLREEFRSSLNLLRTQVEDSTQGLATRLENEFAVKADESTGLLKKVFFLTRNQMTLIQSQLQNISSSLGVETKVVQVSPVERVPETNSILTTEELSTLQPLSFTEEITTISTMSMTSTAMPTTTTTTTTTEPFQLPRDCQEARDKNGMIKSGITKIRVNPDMESQGVWCDQETDNGGWTVMLRRRKQTTQLNFRKDWETYKKGFGDPKGEYWIGLEALHQLTEDKPYRLYVFMRYEDENATSLYDYFRVGPERYGRRGYELTVGGYEKLSLGGDSMEYHNGMDFSTYDEDNDGASGGSCSEWSGGGGWWFNYCYYSNPTGSYPPDDLPPNTEADHFLEWRKWQGYYAFLSDLVMMIKPE